MLSPAGAPFAAAQAPATAKAPAPATAKTAAPAQAPAARPTSAAAAAPAPHDGGWPRAYTTSSGAALVLYQPQVASWTDQKHMVASRRGLVHPERRGQAGARHDQGRVQYQRRARRTPRQLLRVEDRRAELPDAVPREQLKTLVDEIGTSVPLEGRVIALDRVLASIDASKIMPKNVEGVKADPPPIFFSDDSGGAREHRRRTDLGADSAERPDSPPSTPTGICSSTYRPRPSTCATTRPG